MTKGLGIRFLSGILLTGLKFVISAAILYYLFYRINFTLLFSLLRPGGAITAAILMASGVLVWIIEYCRFYLTLKPVTQSVKRSLLIKVFFTGYAMRFILPGGHGEIGKMLFIPGRNAGKLLAYVLDKISFLVVVLIGFIIGFWYFFPAERLYLGILPVLLLGGLILIRRLKRVQMLKRYLLLNYPFFKVASRALGLSLIQVLIVILQYWYLLRPAGIQLHIVAAAVAIILTVIMIPVSIAGLGLREWSSYKLFQRFQAPQELALAVPLMIFTVNILIPAIIGAIFFIFLKTGRASDLSREVSVLLETGRNTLEPELPADSV